MGNLWYGLIAIRIGPVAVYMQLRQYRSSRLLRMEASWRCVMSSMFSYPSSPLSLAAPRPIAPDLLGSLVALLRASRRMFGFLERILELVSSLISQVTLSPGVSDSLEWMTSIEPGLTYDTTAGAHACSSSSTPDATKAAGHGGAIMDPVARAGSGGHLRMPRRR